MEPFIKLWPWDKICTLELIFGVLVDFLNLQLRLLQ